MRNIIISIFLFLGVFANAADISVWQKSTLNKVIQKGELVVGMDPGYMPFEMKDKKGNIIGFDVDIAKLMAKSMGVKLKLIPTAYDGIIGGILADKFDIIISGMTITQERNLKINFSDPYANVGQTLIVQKKYQGKNWRDLDKEGKVIVTKLGVTGEFAAKRMFKKASIKTFDTEADAVQEILNGKADAFIYDKPYNIIFMGEKGGSNIIHWTKELTYEPIGFGIRKGDADFINWLNNFLKQIKGDGKYDAIYKKWFEDTKWLKKVM